MGPPLHSVDNRPLVDVDFVLRRTGAATYTLALRAHLRRILSRSVRPAESTR
jgi:hypothetical protein